MFKKCDEKLVRFVGPGHRGVEQELFGLGGLVLLKGRTINSRGHEVTFFLGVPEVGFE